MFDFVEIFDILYLSIMGVYRGKMNRNFVKHMSLFCATVLLIVVCSCLFVGCQSTDKSDSFFDTSGIEYTSFDYDSQSNKTHVVWATTLTNDTVYNINGFSVTFKLYQGSTLVSTRNFKYTKTVKHGADYTGTFSFDVANEIDSISYVSWSANYDSFWETYKIWIIVMSAIAGAASLIYIIVMIVQQLEIEDTVEAIADFFEEHTWVAVCFLIPVAGTIWGIVTSYWVPVLIILGGIIAFIIVALIAHLIKFAIEFIIDTIDEKKYGNCSDADEEIEDDFDPNIEEVSDYAKDSEKLMLFSVERLKEYCRKNGIKGYSSLKKASLVDLIVNYNDNETDKTKAKKVNTVIEKRNKITFEDIAGLDEAKKAFKEKVVDAFEHKDLYQKYGKKVGGGLLLYGLPGTGKTMFAEAASNETDSLFIPVKCSDIKSKWYGESEANVKRIFEKARKAKKAIIFFDEFEAIGSKRTDNSENANNDLVPQILAEMQGVDSSKSNSVILVIAATNKPWSIDSAFLRPGRFDEKIYIPLPDLEARKKLFELKLKSIPQENLDYDYLADITNGFNGADIGAFCDKLKMLAINKSIAAGNEYPITMEDVEQVKGIIKSSVSPEDVQRLVEFSEQYK